MSKKILLQTVNSHQVKAIPLPHKDTKPVRGADVCKECYANIFCVAKKKSGKTSVIAYLLQTCTSKKTRVVVFCSTLYKDDNWIAIRNWLEQRGNPTEFHTSIFDQGEDQVEKLVGELNDLAMEQEEGQEAEESNQYKDNTDEIFDYLARHGYGEVEPEPEPKKEKKDKYLTPELVIILDDLSDELKKPSLLALLTRNRHYKCKVIVSSQYLMHMLPESRKQMDLFLVFKGQPQSKLEVIYDDADLSIPFPLFVTLYKKATQVNEKCKYPFLYVDTRNEEFRRCFNQQFLLPDGIEE